MKKIKVLLLSGLTMCIALSTGCSTNATGSGGNEDKANAYLEKMEEGKYYVLHKDKSFQEVYWGAATFDEEDVVSSPNDNRVIWFDESMYKQIPTLYQGDELVYRTTDEIVETFNFERFEDFGYSVGLCGLKETDSGRYSISTDKDDNNTFPGGDTDELLLLDNDTVIIDTLGGKALRAPVTTENGVKLNSPVSRCNSILNLKKDVTYKAEIYEGTELKEYNFKADKRIMASMEVRETNDFTFEQEVIMNINIPSDFHNGYYMINGMGVFRYVNGTSYSENDDFNIPNETDENTTSQTGTQEDSVVSEPSESEAEGDPDIGEATESVFTLQEDGVVQIYVKLNDTENPDAVSGIILGPNNERYVMNNAGSSLELTFDAPEIGDYTIQLYGLTTGSADINVNYIN